MEWINVKDRLPEDNTDLLVFASEGWRGIFPAVYYRNTWQSSHILYDGMLGNVTHWMPLPNPPLKGIEIKGRTNN